MRGKLNVKTIVILVVLLVVIVLGVIGVKTIQTFMSGATSDVEPVGVTAISSDDGKTAVVSWTSDKAAISKIEYGTTAASLVLMAIESDSTANHKISLTSLRPNTTYYYRIRIGEDVFDNSGIPYSFKTKGEVVVSVTPTITSTPLASSITPGVECKNGVDYNKDGSTNSVDMIYCRQQGGKIVAVTTTPSPKVTLSTSQCTGTIADYNSDGVINSFDRINCLQSIGQ